MDLLDIIMISFGLAMDAFTVSLSAGTSGLVRGPRAVFRLTFHFGLFQFMMPVIGWFLGIKVEPVISSWDHWIAFGLLSFVGGKMLIGAFKQSEPGMKSDPSKGASLILLSIATSIDALAIGLSLAMLKVDILYPSVMIGIVTGILSLAGVRLGKYIGKKISTNMEIAGGILLIGIGIRILITHL